MTVEIRVELKQGIADAEADSIHKSLGLLGVPGVERVETARIYRLTFSAATSASAQELAQAAVDRLLANPVIHRVVVTPLPG